MNRRSGYLHRGRIPDRVVDLLEVDGGWLTRDGIAVALRAKPDSVYRALLRLRKADRVRSRQWDAQVRSEWRLS